MTQPRTGARFPRTRASVLARLGDPERAERERAFDALVRAYWQPIYTYLRLEWRLEPGQAEDLVQGFLAAAWAKDFFSRYDPAKARLRTFLRVCLDRFVQQAQSADLALKRGGGHTFVPFDGAAIEARLAAHVYDSGGDVEELFRREVVRALLGRAVERLEAELVARGREVVFCVFERYDLGSEKRITYGELATELGLTSTQVTNHLHAARRRLRALVLDELRSVCASEAEVVAEAEVLFGGLRV